MIYFFRSHHVANLLDRPRTVLFAAVGWTVGRIRGRIHLNQPERDHKSCEGMLETHGQDEAQEIFGFPKKNPDGLSHLKRFKL